MSIPIVYDINTLKKYAVKRILFESAIDTINSMESAREQINPSNLKNDKVDESQNSELTHSEIAELRRRFYDSFSLNQMKPWFDLPYWEDLEPIVEISRPKGFFGQLDVKAVIGLPPGRVMDILCDPENTRIFKNIKELTLRKVIEDDGERIRTYIEQSAIWRFLCWTGTFGVCLDSSIDKKSNRIEFKLSKPGFMKKFEGVWEIAPLIVNRNEKINFENLSFDTCSSSNCFFPSSTTTSVSSSSPTSPPTSKSTSLPTSPSNNPLPPTPDLYLQSSCFAKKFEKCNNYVVDEDDGKDLGVRRIASVLTLKQQFDVAISPPFFLKNYVRNIMAKSMKEAFEDLQKEAKWIRYKREIGAEWNEEEEKEKGGGDEIMGIGIEGRGCAEKDTASQNVVILNEEEIGGSESNLEDDNFIFGDQGEELEVKENASLRSINEVNGVLDFALSKANVLQKFETRSSSLDSSFPIDANFEHKVGIQNLKIVESGLEEEKKKDCNEDFEEEVRKSENLLTRRKRDKEEGKDGEERKTEALLPEGGAKDRKESYIEDAREKEEKDEKMIEKLIIWSFDLGLAFCLYTFWFSML